MSDDPFFCDTCGREYDEEVTLCPVCGGKVGKFDSGIAPETAELCEVYDEVEAQAVRNILADNGIYSFIRTNTLPGSRLVLSLFKKRGIGTVIINREDTEKAEKILRDLK